MAYSIYILIHNKKPVYVGCSSNVKNRISNHKRLKKFDHHEVIGTFDNKKDALIAENSIIRFMSMFGDDDWLNARHTTLALTGLQRGLNEIMK